MGMSTNRNALTVNLLKHSGEHLFPDYFAVALTCSSMILSLKIIVFTHFSYERSSQKEMVVDIQGSGSVYTDPQIHSVEKKYGRADRGTIGIAKFFSTHKCNNFCRMLELHDRSEQEYFG